MRLVRSFIFHFWGNFLGILLCDYLIKGFDFSGSLFCLAEIALFLTIFNLIFKPILKFLFLPLIILTLGLGLIFINALGLWLTDSIFESLSIEGILPLLFATFIIGFINLVLISLAKVID